MSQTNFYIWCVFAFVILWALAYSIYRDDIRPHFLGVYAVLYMAEDLLHTLDAFKEIPAIQKASGGNAA